MSSYEKIVVLYECNMLWVFFLGIYESFKMWTYLAIFTLGKFELSFSPVSHLNVYIIFQDGEIESDTMVPLFFFISQMISSKNVKIKVFLPFKNLMFEY